MMETKGETEVWRRALSSLVAVPALHAKPDVQPSDAQDFLRCSERTWYALLADGLPLHNGGLDRLDLVNLALHAGSGNSIPEIALRHALRFVTAGRASWCSHKRWRLVMRLACRQISENDETNRDRAAGERAAAVTEEWRIWRPLPWPGPRARDDASLRVLSGDLVEDSYEVDVTGREMHLVSPLVRMIVVAYLAEERQFVRMPAALQLELGWMREHGLFDCLSASLDLKQRCEQEGIEAKVRQGWLAGLTASPHAWLEILDEDGEWKTVDIAFRALAQLLYPQCDEFCEFCLGSRLNRLLVTESPPTEPIIDHRCKRTSQVETHVTITNIQ